MRRRTAYNALLQTFPGQNSSLFPTPFPAQISAPFSGPPANQSMSIPPLTSATASTTTSASNYEYMPLLKRGDYLQVRFWDKSTFLNTLAGKSATTFGSSNIAKIETTDYLEDENSTPLTEQQRGAMYGHARRFWNTYLQKSGRFPPTYSALDLDTLGHFRSEMERHFFELRLCDNHWKVDEIWIRNYHSWRSSAERQPAMVKTEVLICDDSDPVVKKDRPRPRPRKRKRDHSLCRRRSILLAKKANSRRSETNDAITISDTDFAAPHSGPQVTTPSASDAQNLILPASHSSGSRISVDVSPILSSVAIESAAVSSPPFLNNALGLDVAMSAAPNDSRPLPAASSPLLETSSHVPPSLIQLPTDNEISHPSDTSQLAELGADDETLSAALGLSLLAQPANGKSCQSLFSVVQIFQMRQAIF